MARRAKPWLRKGRGWYVQIDGKQVALGKDKTEAYHRYHALMQRGPRVEVTTDSFYGVCDDFLEWTRKNRAARTYSWYLGRLQLFAVHLKENRGNISVDALRPIDVQKWIDSHPTWGATSQRQSITAVQRCLNWAERMGYVDRSPLRGIEKPAAKPRERVVSQVEYQTILGVIDDEAFRDLLTVSWETGCRPQESLRVEARHVDLANARWVFPPSEAKGGRKPRIVYLANDSLEITKRRVEAYPEGPIFRNTKGRPWTPDAVGCRFSRIKEQLGERYCLYHFRHSFATRMLEAGLDALTVALLLGHSNPAMLSTTYQHLAHNPRHLLEQVRRVIR